MITGSNQSKQVCIKMWLINSLPDDKFLDWSKLKQIADDILTLSQTTNFTTVQIERVCRREFQVLWKWGKVLQKGWKHCGKGEIAPYEQFLLFSQCFQKTYCKLGLVWERVKVHFKWKRSVILGRKHYVKAESACNKQFLFFSQSFPQLYIFIASKCSIIW